MTKDEKNIESLNAYMDEKGIAPEDRNKLPFGEAWISVNDRLPETGEDVLIFTHGQKKEQVVGWLLSSGKWVMELGHNYDEPVANVKDHYVADMLYVVNVTHWQPLPEPPKTA